MSETVYASPTGGRYHKVATCGLPGDAAWKGLPDAWPTVTPEDARARRLTPCRTCTPPTLLALLRSTP